MPLTPEDVQNKRFTVVRFKSGYDEEEVDGFLDEIEAELRRLLGENNSLKQVAAEPAAPPAPSPAEQAPPAPVEEPNETALRTLLLAQRTADDAIAQAQGEAESILSDARSRAGTLEAQAQADHQRRLAALQRERSELETEITALRGFERDFRTRLKAYLQTQLGELEARSTVEPASSAAVATATLGAPAPPSPPATVPPATVPPAAAAAPPMAAGPGAPTGGGVADAPAPTPGGQPLRPPPSASGPFSSAPTPGSAPFASRPAPVGEASAPASAPEIDTDVDARSDAPAGPPAEADEDLVTDGE